MNGSEYMNFQKILIGFYHPFGTLPPPIGSIRDNKKDTIQTLTFNYWLVMVPELICRESYLAVVDTRLLCLEDISNSDQALLIKLCRFFPQNIYVLNDPRRQWEVRSDAPKNLLLWRHSSNVALRDGIETLLDKSGGFQ